MQEKKNQAGIYAAYYMGVFCFTEAFILGSNEGALAAAANLFFFLFFVFLMIGNLFFLNSRVCLYEWMKQMSVCYLVIALFWNVNFICCNAKNPDIVLGFTGLVVLNVSSLLFLAVVLREGIAAEIWDMVRNNKGICCVEILFILLYLQNFGTLILGDAYTYYKSFVMNAGNWDFTLKSLSVFLMGGHTSYAYSCLLSIGELLWHEDGNGIRVVNGILYVLMISAFYGICQKLFGKKQQNLNVLLTVVFAVSPLVFGISYSINSDFPLLCFYTLFVYSAFYQKRIWQWVFVLAVCFTKETGVIMILGYYIGECAAAGKNFFREAFRLRHVVQYAGVFFFLIPMGLSSAGWMQNLRNLVNSDSKVRLENIVVKHHYPLYKISEFFVMNFAWVLLVLAAAACIKKIIQNNKIRKKEIGYQKENTYSKEAVIPLAVSFAAFWAVSIGYFTYVHFRYMQPGIIFYVLLLGYFLRAAIERERNRILVLSVISVLFLVGSYITCDPVTYLLYPNVNIGNGVTVSTRRYFYGGENYGYAYIEGDDELLSQHYQSEGMEYNREQLHRQKLLETVFSSIQYKEDDLIVLDIFGGWKENTCYQLFGHTDSIFWDAERKRITDNQEDIEIQFAIADADIDRNAYDCVYYFKFPYNQYQKDDFVNSQAVKQQWKFIEGRWSMEVFQVK